MYNVDLYGDKDGVFPDMQKDLKPLLVATFLGEPLSDYTGGLAIATGYPFAPKGGFASVITSTLTGPAVLTAYKVAVISEHDHAHVTPSGVHRAMPYMPGDPREASLVTSRSLSQFPSGAIVGAFSTLDGAVVMTVPPGGGPAIRWIAEPKGDSFIFNDGGALGPAGSYVSGM